MTTGTFPLLFSPDQATITVEQSIEGEITKKVLHPGDELATPFSSPESHREWTVTYRHKPATISSGISVVPGVSGGVHVSSVARHWSRTGTPTSCCDGSEG